MKLKRVLLPLFGLLLIACNSDDSPGTTPVVIETPIADFVVIGEDAQNVYQFNFDGDAETGELKNLTQDFDVAPGYITLRQIDQLVSFYYFRQGAFSLVLKDIRTESTARYSDFFASQEGQSVAWGINDESNVFFGFFGPFGRRDLGVQDVEFMGRVGQDTLLDSDIETSYQPILFEGKIYLAYRSDAGQFKFTYYDTVSKTTGPILNFDTTTISFLITEAGEVAIIKNGVDAFLEIYDASSLTLLEEMPLRFGTGFNPGPIDGAVLDDNKLFYEFPNVQPARFPSNPAIFDLETQENQVLDFFGIADQVEAEIGTSFTVATQLYDSTNDIFLIGYAILGNEINGGVIQVSADGELISNIALPFFPSYFVRN